MLTIGKIDRKIYSCVSEHILTDEVIITEERLAHIRKRHPNDYARFQSLISQILKDPDYILEDKHPNTAMVLKTFYDVQQGNHFRIALRLITPEDALEYKNSVITFLKIREKEFQRLIRNKIVLYKKE